MAIAQKEARRQEKLDADARKLSEPLAGRTVTIEARVGESGRLFGSVTNRDIAEKLNADSNLSIDAHIILLPEPIRELGARPVTIRLTRNVSAEITVDVVPDEESKPIVERLMAERAAEEAAEAKRLADAEYAKNLEKGRAAAEAAEAAGESGDEAEAESED
jgi:large subunit ribosomal protein L9